MAFRYDYRNDYKNMNLEQLKESLDDAKEQLLFWVGSDDTWTVKNWSKRVTYLKSKIEKIKL